MPRPSQFMIRASLIWLVVGYTVGGLLLLHKAWPLFYPLWALRSAHIFMLLVGWLVQLSAGVAVWIMPRLVQPGVITGSGDRGDLRLVWLCCGGLNVGVGLVTAHPLLVWLSGGHASAFGWMLALAGAVWLMAVIAFIGNVWQRVRPVIDPIKMISHD
jgi:hypothetical protein